MGFQAFRRLERSVPLETLYRVLEPLARLRAMKLRRPPVNLPSCFGPATAPACPRHRLFLNRMLELIPDRLAEPKWLERCQVEGLEILTRARSAGRPAVLAFCHYGPYPLLRFWLRAKGIPAGFLVRGSAQDRAAIRRKTDGLSPFPDVPVVFCQDQLRQMNEALMAGRPLLVAVDTDMGRTIDVPLDDSWVFTMATGALRMARHHRAELIPATIFDEGNWRFRIMLGNPVPQEQLQSETGFRDAGSTLIRELLAQMRQHPEQVPATLPPFFKARGRSDFPPDTES